MKQLAATGNMFATFLPSEGEREGGAEGEKQHEALGSVHAKSIEKKPCLPIPKYS